MEFPGVLKKLQEEFPGVNQKQSGNSGGDEENGISRGLELNAISTVSLNQAISLN